MTTLNWFSFCHRTDSGKTPWTRAGYVKAKAAKGAGFIVDGQVRGLRSHTMTVDGKKLRFAVVVLDVKLAKRRQFKGDMEVEPKLQDASKHYKGFLNFTKHIAHQFDLATPDELAAAVGGGSGGALPAGWYDAGASNLHPAKPGVFEFWGTEDQVRSRDLGLKEIVRLKTDAHTPFIQSLVSLDKDGNAEVTPGHGGEYVLGGWMDLAAKKVGGGSRRRSSGSKRSAGKGPASPKPSSTGEGADDDEWD